MEEASTLAWECSRASRRSAPGSSSGSDGSRMPPRCGGVRRRRRRRGWWRTARRRGGLGTGDVAGLAVQAAGSDDEHLVAGDALGLVDGDGVAVVDVTVPDVGAVEDDASTGGQVDGHRPRRRVESGDGADHAVVDPARSGLASGGVDAGVAGEDDPVAGLEVAAGDVEDGTVEQSGGGGAGPAVAVECSGFGAGAGEQEGVAAVPVGVPPVPDRRGVNILEAVVEHDAAVVW